ncbi:MAG: nucleotide exchange factor GrpE, partial [Bacteroidales bacterium]|nr:nucleotide exchange factor GrpE [Bacteroidales bacterium]
MAKNKEELKDEKKEEKKEEKKDRIAELEAEAKKLSDQIAEEKNSYLKLMAEFETFRRRTAEEKLALVGSASAETIKGLLPVLDDCERAMELLAQSSDEAAKEGTSLIYNKLMAYLKTRGLEKIEAKGA